MNPSQKSGNYKKRKTYVKPKKGDYHTKQIARMEAKKVLAKKVESKTYDTQSIAFAVDNIPLTIFDMTAGIVRGTLENNYIGDSILPTHLRIKWVVEGVDAFNTLRVIVLQNKAGGVPVGGTLLQLSGTINAPQSPYNTDFNETYKVLYDELFLLSGIPGGVGGTMSSVITGDIRILSNKLHKMNFTSPAGVLSVDGIYLVFVSDSLIAPHPIGRYTSRLYFKDA